VLSTSPLLLEKYLAAAEKISAEAIDVNHPTIAAPRKRLEAESLEASKDSGSAALGGFIRAPRIVSSYAYGAICSANSVMTSIATTITAPTAPSGF